MMPTRTVSSPCGPGAALATGGLPALAHRGLADRQERQYEAERE